MSRAEHDGAYRALFSHKEVVRDLIREFAPPDIVAGLDLDAIQPFRTDFMGSGRRRVEVDALWVVPQRRGDNLYVLVHLEFQSTAQRSMPARMLMYAGAIYTDLVDHEPKLRNRPLPPLLALVFYNGLTPWRVERDVRDQIGVPAELSGLDEYQPRMRYLVLDPSTWPQEQLEGYDGLAALVVQAEAARSTEELMSAVEHVIDHPQMRGDDADALRRAFLLLFTRSIGPTHGIHITTEQSETLQGFRTMLHERLRAIILKEAYELGEELAEGIAEERAKVLAEERAKVLAEERVQVFLEERAQAAVEERAQAIIEERAQQIAEERAQELADDRYEMLLRERLEARVESKFGSSRSRAELLSGLTLSDLENALFLFEKAQTEEGFYKDLEQTLARKN